MIALNKGDLEWIVKGGKGLTVAALRPTLVTWAIICPTDFPLLSFSYRKLGEIAVKKNWCSSGHIRSQLYKLSKCNTQIFFQVRNYSENYRQQPPSSISFAFITALRPVSLWAAPSQGLGTAKVLKVQYL